MKTLATFLILITIGIFVLQSNNSDNSKEDKYNRTYSDFTFLESNGKKYKNKTSDLNFYIPSKESIVFAKRDTYSQALSKLYFMNPVKLEIFNEIDLELPANASLLYADEIQIFYRVGFKVYHLDIQSGEAILINNKYLKIKALSPLNAEQGLILGSFKGKNNYSFGYLKFDFKSKKITDTLMILENWDLETDDFVENSLKYSGRFHYSNGSYIYVFDKYGKVILFKENGDLFKTISTLDKVQLPAVTYFNGMYTYKRGATFNSNAAAFLNDKYLYTFSCRPNNVNYMLLDKYNLSTGAYMESFKVTVENKKSSDINYLAEDDANNIILGFNNSLYQFQKIND